MNASTTTLTTPWSVFRIVFRKELRELLRDRKTVFWLLAPPFILPAIAIIAAVFIGSQTARYITQGFPVTVINGQAAPGLLKTLKASKALIVTETVTDPTNSVSQDGASQNPTLITLTIPDDFQQQLDAGEQAHLTLTQRDNTFVSTLALGAVRSEIGVYSSQVADQRLKASGHDNTWLSPINVNETQAAAAATSVTASSATDSGGSSSGPGLGALFLPLAITSWLIGGGLGLRVDTTLGEKGRQTIESVLVTPPSRLGIGLRKLTAGFLPSLVVIGLWMGEGLFLSPA